MSGKLLDIIRGANRATLNVGGLLAFEKLIRQTMYQRGNTPGHQMLRKWGVRYLGFVKRRFVKLSRSGGGEDWPLLAASTIRSRRKGAKVDSRGRVRGKGGQYVVSPKPLRDTGALLAALDLGNPGNLFREKPGYIEVGFAETGHGSDQKLTMAKLAAIHNLGTRRIPARPILVEPDEKTINGMMQDGETAMRQILGKAAIE